VGSSNKKDLYGVLGLPGTASQEDVRKAHRRLAREYHPDANPADARSAAERFKEVQNAYEVLSDPEKRREYDDELRRVRRSAAASSPSSATTSPGGSGRSGRGTSSGRAGGAGGGRSTSDTDLSDLLGRLKDAFRDAKARASTASEQHVPGSKPSGAGSGPREKKVKGPNARGKEKRVKGPNAKRKGG